MYLDEAVTYIPSGTSIPGIITVPGPSAVIAIPSGTSAKLITVVPKALVASIPDGTSNNTNYYSSLTSC